MSGENLTNKILTRREFLKLADETGKAVSLPYALARAALELMTTGEIKPSLGYAVQAARLLEACDSAPNQPSVTAPPEKIISAVPEELSLFSVLTRLNHNAVARLDSVTDPAQRDILYAAFTQNDQIVRSGFIAVRNQAMKDGTVIYVSGCSDSRFCLADIFPTIVESSEDVWGITQQVNRVGAQPALFPEGAKFSAFIPHQTECNITTGCGFAAAVKQALSSPEGLTSLEHHGVSQTTIEEVKRMIDLGNTGDPSTWARIGAQVQAEINAYQNGGNHFVAYGVYGHADETLMELGVVDELGNIYDINNPQFKLLKDFFDFNNQPHPVFEAIAQGQAPKINILNGSRRFTSAQLLGDLTQEQGTVFKSSVDLTNSPLSLEEATQVVGGIDYSLLHLPQSGRVLVLTADNYTDLTALRMALYTKSEGLADFISKGGVIVELIPEVNTGKFSGLVVVRTAADMKNDLGLLQIMAKGALSDEVITSKSLLQEVKDISSARKFAGVLTEAEYAKLIEIWNSLGPVRSLVKFGLQVVGDAVSLYQLATLIDENVMGHALVWSNPVSGTEFNLDFQDPNRQVLTDSEVAQINQRLLDGHLIPDNYKYDRLLAELVHGNIGKVIIHEADMVSAYTGTWNACYERCKGGKQEAPPWKDLDQTALGTVLILSVRSPVSTNGIVNFVTPLIIRPGYDQNGVTYFNLQTPDDVHTQVMRLDNEVTGLPIPGDIAIDPVVFMASRSDQPEIIYLFQVSARPENRTFEFKFVGVQPVVH